MDSHWNLKYLLPSLFQVTFMLLPSTLDFWAPYGEESACGLPQAAGVVNVLVLSLPCLCASLLLYLFNIPSMLYLYLH